MNPAEQSPKQPPRTIHRRQALLQIWLPLGFVVTIFLALCVTAVYVTTNDYPVAGTWAPISLMFLLIPNCLVGILLLVVLVGLIALASKSYRGLPGLTAKIQKGINQLSSLVQKLSDKAAQPVVSVRGWQAGWGQFWASIWPKKNP